MNYYNDNCKHSAAWIRQLIEDKIIPPGEVDDRSIKEVTPDDVKGFTQCHWFAGVAGWSRALQLAGWPSDRPVWTASLPCQGFSVAGKQLGIRDERHLWPVFERLVRVCRPGELFGEQVSSKLARVDWLPRVCMDLQELGYAATAVDLCAPCAGTHGEGRFVRGDQDEWESIIIGAPHIRQRIFWLAYSIGERCRGSNPLLRTEEEGRITARLASQATRPGGLAHADCAQRQGSERHGYTPRREGPPDGSADGRLANADRVDGDGAGLGAGDDSWQQQGSEGLRRESGLSYRLGHPYGAGCGEQCGAVPVREELASSELRSHAWSTFDFLPCTDGKARRIKSGLQPLVDGLPRGMVPVGDPSLKEVNQTAEGRPMRLRGYGNAIVAPLAAKFVAAYMEIENELQHTH